MNTTIKTLDQLLDEHAVEAGFENYLEYCNDLSLSDSEWMEIAETYAKQFKDQLSATLKLLSPNSKQPPNF